MKKVSFVIPCYRSEHTLPHVVKEIEEKMKTLKQYEYDLILVNDCSPDDTFGTIRTLCREHKNIKGISFAKNFGQHAALMAGLRHSDGDYVVCLDDDGQTPADEVDKLLEKLEEIANTTPGVEKSFAIQAGREIRIIAKPEDVNDEEIVFLAREISKKIEAELEYPGQIKVNVVRETRAIDYAK